MLFQSQYYRIVINKHKINIQVAMSNIRLCYTWILGSFRRIHVRRWQNRNCRWKSNHALSGRTLSRSLHVILCFSQLYVKRLPSGTEVKTSRLSLNLNTCKYYRGLSNNYIIIMMMMAMLMLLTMMRLIMKMKWWWWRCCWWWWYLPLFYCNQMLLSTQVVSTWQEPNLHNA